MDHSCGSAVKVGDDVALSPDDEEPEREEPISLREMARPTAQEGRDLKKQLTAAKSQVTKADAKLEAVMAKLAEKGISLDDEE